MPLLVYLVAAVVGFGITASVADGALSPAHFVCIAH
jgi:hypothetical protein